jgi:hypothetical protein
MTTSKQKKGNAYERELARYFTDHMGVHTERSPLSGGGRGLTAFADLYGPPHLWIEAKRQESLDLYGALAQAERGRVASGCPDLPVVIHRRNRMRTGESIVSMRLDVFFEFYDAFLRYHGYK